MAAPDPLPTSHFAASVKAMDMGAGREQPIGQAPALIMLAALALAGCASNPLDVFEGPERHLGETIRVHGWLVYESESSNLYPSSDYEEDLLDGRCIPIGVMSNEGDLDVRLSDLNRSFVTISGTVERIIPAPTAGEEWVSTRHCRDFGVRVRDVQRSLRSFTLGQE